MSGPSVGEREAFETWYSTYAFDYERNPIGSRDCAMQWKAWQASRAELLSQVEKAEAFSTSELQQLEFDIGQGKYTAAWVFTRMRQYLSRGKPAPSTDRVAAQGGDDLVESIIASVSRVNTEGMDGDLWDRILVRAAIKALRATPADGDK